MGCAKRTECDAWRQGYFHGFFMKLGERHGEAVAAARLTVEEAFEEYKEIARRFRVKRGEKLLDDITADTDGEPKSKE